MLLVVVLIVILIAMCYINKQNHTKVTLSNISTSKPEPPPLPHSEQTQASTTTNQEFTMSAAKVQLNVAVVSLRGPHKDTVTSISDKEKERLVLCCVY